ncbi:MAG: TolC family protein [Succinivibrionaceae bacterium]
MLKKICAVVLTAITLTGCTVLHSDYERPELYNYTFVNGVASDNKSVNQNIWEVFDDERLTNLIIEAFNSNSDYLQAVINARKALLQADQTATNLIPTLSADLSSKVSKSLDNGESSKKSSSSNLGLSYELDLFGKLSAERKVSNYSAESTLYDAQTARLMVASSVATIYWKIVYYKEAVRIGEANLSDSKETFDIIKSRFENGSVSELEYIQAKRDMVEVETNLHNYRTGLVNSISAMNTLLNRVPNTEVDTSNSLKELKLPTIPAGISADILKYRPDVSSAESNLKKALANVDVSKLELYPTFKITAGINAGDSSSLVKFFNNPLGSLGAMLSFPFLNYYQRSLDIDIAKLDKDSAELKFVTTYYKALGEVQESLNNVELYKKILLTDKERLSLNKQAEEIYKTQYQLGKVSLKDYLEAKTLRRKMVLQLCQDKMEQLNNLMISAKSMGVVYQ